jgi:type IV secretory pathway VirB9-like protein
MHLWILVVALGFLAGCATSHPMVVSSPIPDEVGWSAPQMEPVEVTPPPPVPERPASPVEHVHPFEDGRVYDVRVAVKNPMIVMLQTGERIDHVAQDRVIIPEGEDGSPWTVSESKAHTPPRPVVIIHATKPGLTQGISITTDRRVYLLDVRSVVASKVRLVRWDYGPEPVQVKVKPRLLPDPSTSQTYYGGYRIEAATRSAPSWTPRQVVNDQQGKTYIIFPSHLTTITAPLLRLVGSNGPELVNYRQVGTTYILDGLFNLAELRVGNGKTAEVVRIHRDAPQRLTCPGDAGCPVWPDRVAGR